MNRINTDNYEAFVLDYLEGRLNQEQSEALKQFVLLHPELNLDLDADLPAIKNDAVVFSGKSNIKRDYTPAEENILNYLENTMDPAEKVKFEHKLELDPLLSSELNAFRKTKLWGESELRFELKDKLSKTEDDFYLNNKSIQYLEGEFNHEEALAFEKELAFNSGLNAEFALYRKIKLEADVTIEFENKTVLKKETLILPLFRARVVYSAAAALALVVVLSVVMNRFLNTPELQKHKPSLSAVSSGRTAPNASEVKQNQSTNANKTPGVEKQVVLPKQNKLNTLLALSSETLTNSPLALNEFPVDTLSQQNNNSVAGHSLAPENQDKPVPPAEKESLEKLEYAYMIPFEEEEEEETSSENGKKITKGFWSFATRLAKKANQIGIKSINGSEDGNNNYLLSFNAMTIEKK